MAAWRQAAEADRKELHQMCLICMYTYTQPAGQTVHSCANFWLISTCRVLMKYFDRRDVSHTRF